MLQQVSNYQPTNFTSMQYPMQGMGQQAVGNIPVASKFTDETQKAKTSLYVLGGGAALGPVLGMGLDKMMGPEGPIVKFSDAVSRKTPWFDKLLGNLKIGEKISKITAPLKRPFKAENVKIFKDGFHAGQGTRGTAETAIRTAAEAPVKFLSGNAVLEQAKQLLSSGNVEGAKTLLAGENALLNTAELLKKGTDVNKVVQSLEKAVKASAEALPKAEASAKTALRSLETLEKVEKMGALGRASGKFGLFLKNNLTGLTGVLNGLFAAMTVNSVIKAKKGEKVSTFMEDFLGTWIGSFGGYKLFERVLNGLNKVAASGAKTGILPKIANVVSKIPAKQFVLPLIGAMVLSSALQKLSHAVFGKPTKDEPKVIDSVEGFQDWLHKTGWSPEEFQAIRSAQGLPNNPGAAQTQSQQQPEQQNNAYKGYMPAKEIPKAIFDQDEKLVAGIDSKIEQTLKDIDKGLSQVGVKI